MRFKSQFSGFFVICLACCFSLLHASAQTIFLSPPENFSPRVEVAGCYCEYQNKMLYLLRNENRPQGLSWCVPGGKLERGETSLQAVIREVKEEIDVDLPKDAVQYCRTVYVRFPTTDLILHLFHVNFEQEPSPLNLDLEENVDYRWATYEEVLQLPLIQGGKECFLAVLEDQEVSYP